MAADKYLASKSTFYGTAYEVRDKLSRLDSGQNPDGTPYRPSLLGVLPHIDARDYGVKLDWQSPTTNAASMTSGSNQLTVSSYTFTTADVGKRVVVKGAGAAGVVLYGWIGGITAGKAILYSNSGFTTALNASTTVSTAAAAWGTDDTTALNNFFAALAADGNQRYGFIPSGWTRFTQLVIPSGVKVRTSGWGDHFGVFYGLKNGHLAGTLLQQLEGVGAKHAVVFTPQFTSSVPFIGPLDIELGTLQGPIDSGSSGSGIYCGLADGTAARPQDGFNIRDTHVIGFAGSAFHFPTGCVPIQDLSGCRAFYNRDYGLRVEDDPVTGLVQTLSVSNFSGDGNGLGLVYLHNIRHPTNSGVVTLRNIKSEQNSLLQQAGVHEWAEVGKQRDCIIIDACTCSVHVDGLDHISAEKDLVADPTGNTYRAPNAAIVVTGSYQPSLTWTAVSTRVLNSTDTHPEDAVVLRDDNLLMTVPKEIQNGEHKSRRRNRTGDVQPRVTAPDHLERLRAGLANADVTKFPIVVVGDSHVHGEYWDGSTLQTANATCLPYSPATRLRTKLAARLGITPGEGFIFPDDSRLTLGGGIGTGLSTGPAALRHNRRFTANTHTITLAMSNWAGQNIKAVGIILSNRSGDTGITYTVRGSGALALTPDGTDIPSIRWMDSAAANSTTSGLGALDTDTYVVTGPSSGQCTVIGFVLLTQAGYTTGAPVHRIGQMGYTLPNMGGGVYNGTLWTPDGTNILSSSQRTASLRAHYRWAGTSGLMIINFATNEQTKELLATGIDCGVTPALFQSALTTIVQQVTSDGWCVVINMPCQSGSETASPNDPLRTYAKLARQVAIDNAHVAFHDSADYWGRSSAAVTAAGASGTYQKRDPNSSHPSILGYADGYAGPWDRICTMTPFDSVA